MSEISTTLFWFTIAIMVYYSFKSAFNEKMQLEQKDKLTPANFIFYIASVAWVFTVLATNDPYYDYTFLNAALYGGISSIMWGAYQDYYKEKKGIKKTSDMSFFTKLMVCVLYIGIAISCIVNFGALYF